MILRELIAKLNELGKSYLDTEVYVRYDDDNLIHGQKSTSLTVVIIADQGKDAYQRVVLNGRSRD